METKTVQAKFKSGCPMLSIHDAIEDVKLDWLNHVKENQLDINDPNVFMFSGTLATVRNWYYEEMPDLRKELRRLKGPATEQDLSEWMYIRSTKLGPGEGLVIAGKIVGHRVYKQEITKYDLKLPVNILRQYTDQMDPECDASFFYNNPYTGTELEFNEDWFKGTRGLLYELTAVDYTAPKFEQVPQIRAGKKVMVTRLAINTARKDFEPCKEYYTISKDGSVCRIRNTYKDYKTEDKITEYMKQAVVPIRQYYIIGNIVMQR